MNNNEPYSARFGDGSDVDDLIYGGKEEKDDTV